MLQLVQFLHQPPLSIVFEAQNNDEDERWTQEKESQIATEVEVHSGTRKEKDCVGPKKESIDYIENLYNWTFLNLPAEIWSGSMVDHSKRKQRQ